MFGLCNSQAHKLSLHTLHSRQFLCSNINAKGIFYKQVKITIGGDLENTRIE